MNGVVVVDKPRGKTSFDVVAAVRRMTGVRRVGHAGTLDPLATGVLPVCLGEATKLTPFLMGGEKIYEAEATFGVETDTLDADGAVTRTADASALERAAVETALATFVGRIMQIPPIYSALRQEGRRLYELARSGEAVEPEARPVEVFAIRLDTFDAPACRARFTVRCGKGTYIRSLVRDLGQRLGVGAHMSQLRRAAVGSFTLDGAIALSALSAQPPLWSLADALSHLPALRLDAEQARDVRDGKMKVVAALPAPLAPLIRLLRPDGSLLAVARRVDAELSLLRVFC